MVPATFKTKARSRYSRHSLAMALRVLYDVKHRRLEFFGHVLRNENYPSSGTSAGGKDWGWAQALRLIPRMERAPPNYVPLAVFSVFWLDSHCSLWRDLSIALAKFPFQLDIASHGMFELRHYVVLRQQDHLSYGFRAGTEIFFPNNLRRQGAALILAKVWNIHQSAATFVWRAMIYFPKSISLWNSLTNSKYYTDFDGCLAYYFSRSRIQTTFIYLSLFYKKKKLNIGVIYDMVFGPSLKIRILSYNLICK